MVRLALLPQMRTRSSPHGFLLRIRRRSLEYRLQPMMLSLETLKVVLQALLLRAAQMTFMVPPIYGQNLAAWRPTTSSEMPVVRAGRIHIQIVQVLRLVVQYGDRK